MYLGSEHLIYLARPDYCLKIAQGKLTYQPQMREIRLLSSPALIEVEVDTDNLRPDEDYMYLIDPSRKDWEKYVHLPEYAEMWLPSFEIASAGHFGPIPPESIKRIITDPFELLRIRNTAPL